MCSNKIAGSWTTTEIIENSDKWNLAADVTLLNTLKEFANNLITKSTTINSSLHNLIQDLDKTKLQLNISQNEFQGLCNTQFIESRVYEDDESLLQPENKNEPTKTKPDPAESLTRAALNGLQVLNCYHEKIEVFASDSEDDSDLPNYVLRPIDRYIDRPLPYLIGSKEWQKSLHVGLDNSSSESDAETHSAEENDESDSSDYEITKNIKQIKDISGSSSEFEFCNNKNYDNDNKSFEVKQSSDSDGFGSMPVGAPISTEKFAEELAAKLGNVVDQDIAPVEINRRPIQHQKKSSQLGDLLAEEPPPLSDTNEPFSGGAGLFDDDDNDADFYPTIADNKPERSHEVFKKPEQGIFDDSSDDDIFSSKKAVSSVSKRSLFCDEPPLLDQSKKPVGGVAIFGGANLFDKIQKPKAETPPVDEIEDKTEKSHKGIDSIDLFNESMDDTDLFQDISQKITSSKKSFLDDEEDDKKIKPDLFSTEIKESSTNKGKASDIDKSDLFDDYDDDTLFKSDLFSSSKTKFSSKLFDDIDDESDDLFGGNQSKTKKTTTLFKDLDMNPDNANSINFDINTKTVPLPPDKTNLFEDDSLIDDLLFSNIEQTTKDNSSSRGVFQQSSSLFSPKKDASSLFSFNTTKSVSDTKVGAELLGSAPGVSDPQKDQEAVPEDPLLFNNTKPRLEQKQSKSVAELFKTSKEQSVVDSGALAKLEQEQKIKTNDSSFERSDGATVTLLQTVTKGRAKLPSRRPSTRQGRKVALENASTDFRLEINEISEDELHVKRFEPTLVDSSASKSNETVKSNIIDDHDDDDFDTQITKKFLPRTNKYQRKPLFGDDDDDDNSEIFGS